MRTSRLLRVFLSVIMLISLFSHTLALATDSTSDTATAVRFGYNRLSYVDKNDDRQFAETTALEGINCVKLVPNYNSVNAGNTAYAIHYKAFPTAEENIGKATYKYAEVNYFYKVPESQSASADKIRLRPFSGGKWLGYIDAAGLDVNKWSTITLDISSASLSGDAAWSQFQLQTFGGLNAARIAEGEEFYLSSVRFFNSITDQKHTVTYNINGTVSTKEFIDNALLTLPSPAEVHEDCGDDFIFGGWYLNNEAKTRAELESLPVTEDMELSATFSKSTPELLFTADMITPKGQNGFTAKGLTVGSDGVLKQHFTSGNYTNADGNEVNTSDDNTRVNLILDETIFPTDFKLADYPFIKVAYNGYIQTAADSVEFSPEVYVPAGYKRQNQEIVEAAFYTRIWQKTGLKQSLKDEASQKEIKTLVFNSFLCMNGESEYVNKSSNNNSFDFVSLDAGHCRKIVLKPYANGTAFKDGGYYDVQYVAFFDSEAAANAFVYNAPKYRNINVKFDSSEGSVNTENALVISTVADDAETDKTTCTLAVENETALTLTATPGTGYKMDGWYDITNGQNRLLTHDATVTLESITSNRDVEVRFYAESVGAVKKLIVLADDTGIGEITIDSQKYDWYDDYRDDRSEVTITATPKDSESYFTAFWWRLSSDEKVISYLTYGETLEAMPLGSGVWYQPVYGKKGETVRLYVDSANVLVKLIGDVGDNSNDTAVPTVPARDGYSSDGAAWECVVDKSGFELYKPKYASKENNEATLTIAWADGKREQVNNVPYDSQVTFSGHDNFHHWNIKVGAGEEYVLSYDRNYTYCHVFDEKVVITEVLNDNSEKASLAHTLDARLKDNRIEFAAAIAFDSTKYELVERGVLLSDTISDPGKLQLSTAGVIEGKIDESATAFTGIYLVAKSKVEAGDTWYGRAYMIVRDKVSGELETVYADEILDFEVQKSA